MAKNGALFICYAHIDMASINWIERLRLYLAPLRRRDLVEIWDDSRIAPGSQWPLQIEKALARASTAILLVGPGFLDSDFIQKKELPTLLTAAQGRDVRIYPLVVGYCAYKTSVLGSYQAFNSPDMPLEMLPVPEQNRILNEISMLVDKDMRLSFLEMAAPPLAVSDFRTLIQAIKRNLGDTKTAFIAQCRQRDILEAAIRERLHIKDTLEYEKFFFKYYPDLDREEKFQFEEIRAITEGPLNHGNRQMLELIEQNSSLIDEIPEMMELRQHLVFWLNKYDRVFSARPEMCLLYVGVEDGVPFPRYIERTLDSWLKSHGQAIE